MFFKVLLQVTFLGFILLFSNAVRAFDNNATTYFKTDLFDLKKNNFKTDLSLSSYNYSNGYDAENAVQNSFQENYIHLGLGGIKKVNQFSFYGQGLFDNDLNRSKNSSVGVKELGLDYMLNQNAGYQTQISVGRTIHFTNHLDQQLHLGLVHPYYTLDNINFETEGLVGVEVIQSNGGLSLFAGYYPIFMPIQEPSVHIKNNQAITQNRWSKSPPKFYSFQNKNKEIQYKIEDYNESELANNSSFRLGAKSDFDRKTGLTQLAAGFKRGPLHAVPLSRETYADLDIVGQVKLGPAMNYSNQYALDSKFEFGPMNVLLSYIKDVPDKINATEGHSVQTLSPIEARGITLESHQLNIHGLDQSLYVTYAVLSNGHIIDLNSDGSENIFTFSKYRQQYFKPLKIGAKNSFYSFLKNPISTKLEYIYDSVQKGSVLSLNSSYPTETGVRLNIGFDILGSQYSPEQASDYFISKYQENDRVYGGIEYVF